MRGIPFPVGREAPRAPRMSGCAKCGPDSWFPWQRHSCNSLGLLPGQMTTMTASQTASSCAHSRRGQDAEWAALPPLSLSGSSLECVPQAATPLAWTTSAGKSGCRRVPGWGPGPRSRPGDATVSLCKLGQDCVFSGPCLCRELGWISDLPGCVWAAAAPCGPARPWAWVTGLSGLSVTLLAPVGGGCPSSFFWPSPVSLQMLMRAAFGVSPEPSSLQSLWVLLLPTSPQSLALSIVEGTADQSRK